MSPRVTDKTRRVSVGSFGKGPNCLTVKSNSVSFCCLSPSIRNWRKESSPSQGHCRMLISFVGIKDTGYICPRNELLTSLGCRASSTAKQRCVQEPPPHFPDNTNEDNYFTLILPQLPSRCKPLCNRNKLAHILVSSTLQTPGKTMNLVGKVKAQQVSFVSVKAFRLT